MTLAQLTPPRGSKVMPAARPQDPPQQAGADGSAYQRLLQSLHGDPKWQAEVSLGRRAGFYRFRGDLGSGNFSQVKMAVHQLTREQVAVKILDKSRLEQKTRRMLAREIATMEAIHHPNIIRLYEVVETYSKIYLVMEYARGGELFNKVTSSGRFSEPEARPLFAQIVSAVEYMHDHNFIHRDIKAENVFYATPSLVKLGDFGFSTQLTSGADQRLNTFCGSPPYAAPELFRDESYLGGPVDVWALGVLLYFMVTAQIPFKAQTVASLKQHILDGSFAVPGYVSAPCRRLVEGILRQCPRERPTPAQIRGSEWLQGVGFPERPGPAEDPGLGAAARARLEELGVSGALLEEHQGRGVRSAVVGTYRIVTHRLQRQATAGAELEEPAPPRSAGTTPDHRSRLGALARHARSAVPAAPRGKRHRSRACSLL
ncbi:serine/threonine-protein kinase NIM1-like [Bacillus rossius redtenbacheri]|uniref:serine/threonine-protein kinase NIM1-like n=1 Tax=Bacillus rossius redtenbacheri TaxID=93214 RepID=UPI002FDE9B69